MAIDKTDTLAQNANAFITSSTDAQYTHIMDSLNELHLF